MEFDSSGYLTHRTRTFFEDDGSQDSQKEWRWENIYDAMGKIKKRVALLYKSEGVMMGLGEEIIFKYDLNGRLDTRKRTNSKGKPALASKYQYNKNGVLESKRDRFFRKKYLSAVTRYKWSSDGQLVQAYRESDNGTMKVKYKESDNKGFVILFEYKYQSDLEISLSKTVWTADQELNLLSRRWDYGDEAKPLSLSGEGKYEYQYDATGNWTTRTYSGSTTHISDDGETKFINREEIERKIEYFE